MEVKQEAEQIDYIMPYLQDLVLCSRLDIEYMTINMPFIGIQARED
jgi:hypothetical protein